MKIYTKTGDRGDTSLIGGRRVSKSDIQIEAYGTIDELIAFVGYLRDNAPNEADASFLIQIQDKLMIVAALLSRDEKNPNVVLPALADNDILLLEKEIDKIENVIPPLTAFILPGGHPGVSLCHVVRTVCRRAERSVIAMALNLQVDEVIIRYLNRLSDYFFVLTRKWAKDLNIREIEWHPDL
ncbi:MAG TPA: cob(I)yrinic acid a,c-diamide adenosyltransferase [Bacteroidales bacterium]|nr:cob(I)yrinic acid a,c-diamide adenosyltransferase [Bacteroidales bacterium]HOK97983.1 cob(I)yrinic acid a,c-diamide adenosyltransferase [Bacteroidales bacterium]HPO65294.1 cob(I)yrinic acid a,c-diamide adenosyltransferase [Bacteroidales bacterium]